MTRPHSADRPSAPAPATQNQPSAAAPSLTGQLLAVLAVVGAVCAASYPTAAAAAVGTVAVLGAGTVALRRLPRRRSPGAGGDAPSRSAEQ